MNESEKPDWGWDDNSSLMDDYYEVGHWVLLPLAAMLAASTVFLWSWGAGIVIENLVFTTLLLLGGLIPLIRRFLKR